MNSRFWLHSGQVIPPCDYEVKTVSMTKKYRDNNITGVDFGQEAVQQNWQVKGSEGSVGSDLVQVFSLSIVSK